MSEFVRKHNIIDEEIKCERAKSKLVHKIFLIIDSVTAVLIIAVSSFLWYERKQIIDSGGDSKQLTFIILLYPPILDAIFSLILASSAYYLALSIK